jgi:DNA replicative helicase MCM subunit Mcm2 (Cdc46/Mcm family)
MTEELVKNLINNPALSGFSARSTVSVDKISYAIAKSELSYEIKREHIDEALSFLKYKLEFFNSLNIITPTINITPKTKEEKELEVKEMIMKLFEEKETTIKEIHSQVSPILVRQYSLRTIKRYVDDMVVEEKFVVERISNDKYKFGKYS